MNEKFLGYGMPQPKNPPISGKMMNRFLKKEKNVFKSSKKV